MPDLQVQSVAEAFLTERLPVNSLVSVEVHAEPDAFDIPSLYVVARVRDQALVAARRVRSSILVDLQDAMRTVAKDRFTYLDFTSQAEEAEQLLDDGPRPPS